MNPVWWRYDLTLLVASVMVIGLSVVMSPAPEVLTLFGLPLPPMCAYKTLFGFECLGCGLTRSFTYMGHMNLAMAWEMHRLGPVLWSIVGFQLPYRIVRLWMGHAARR